MKIKDASEVGAPQPREPARPARESGRSDKVSIERSRDVRAAVASARLSTGAARAAKLREVAAQVKAGAIEPDVGRIAQRILDAAELEAQLRALMSR